MTKAILIIIGLTQLITWGIPPLFASPFTAEVFGVEHAGEFSHWSRYTGMLNLIWGLMVVCAAFHPRQNTLIINFSIALYSATFLLTIIMLFFLGEMDLGQWAWWLPIVSSLVFTILLIVFHPKRLAQRE